MTKDTNLSLNIASPTCPAPDIGLESDSLVIENKDDSPIETTWNIDGSEGFHSEPKRCFLSSEESVKALSEGLLLIYEDDLMKIRKNLAELTKTQKILIETVQQENVRFKEMRNQYILDEIFNKTKQYHAKLLQIKKEMAALHDRSSKLKKRSLRLQEYKQKEALQRELHKEKQAERERQILAKAPTPISETVDLISS